MKKTTGSILNPAGNTANHTAGHTKFLTAILTIALTAALALTLCGCAIKFKTAPTKASQTGQTVQTDSANQVSDIKQAEKIEQANQVAQQNDDILETIRIISTSDTHGKMIGYDYISDTEDLSGSLAQIASALKEVRNDNTILIDIGDSTQDNMAELFVDEDIHPMMQGLNMMNYDICTAGNHEFNFGVDFVKKYISTCKAKFILGNVYDESGEPLADAYTIIEKNGVKIAFIGMVSPNIVYWDAENLKHYTVTDPAEETNKIIDQLEQEKSADIYVGVYHMMAEDEYDTPHSGFASMAEACPRLSLILGAHGHALVNQNYANNIPISENLNAGRTIQIADITFKIQAGAEESTNKINQNRKITIKEIKTMPLETADYPEDPEIVEQMAPYDKAAREYIAQPFGTLEGGPLVKKNEITSINAALMEDSALLSLVQEVMQYYSGAEIAAAAISTPEDNLQPGELTLADARKMYKYSNTLYKLQMTGSQLKKYMEWSASFYQQYEEGDLTIAFNDVPVYLYDTFSGVKYDIDISKPAGERIVNLTRANGKPIADDDTFIVAVNNYRASTALTVPGVIYEEDEIPEIIEKDVSSNIGDIRMMIVDYIKNVKGGKITPRCDNNWKIIGNEWDEALHQEAVEAVNNGKLTLKIGEKSNPCISKITLEDLLSAE